jgi:hypothetical protein
MSGQDGDVPHYCAHAADQQARRVPPDALDTREVVVLAGFAAAFAALAVLVARRRPLTAAAG